MEEPTFLYDKTFLYHLNSANRSSGTNGDFEIKIDITNGYNIEDFDSVCLLSASIPKSYYAIQEGKNTFILTEGVVDTTITIPPGTYSATNFANLVASLLTTQSPNNWTYTCSINLSTAKFTWTSSGPPISPPTFKVGDYLYERLGFDKGEIVEFNPISGLTSKNVINMSPEADLFIRSNIIAGGADANEDIFYDVQASNIPAFGRIQVIDSDPQEYTKVLNNTTNIYNFFLTDEFGTKLNLNGLNWTATILFYKKSTLPDKIDSMIKLMAESF